MIFLGAGASAPFRIPTSPWFTEQINKILNSENKKLNQKFTEYYKKYNNGENPDFEIILNLLKYSTNSLTIPNPTAKIFFINNPELKSDYSDIIQKMNDVVYLKCCSPFEQNKESSLSPKETEQIFSVTYDAIFSHLIRHDNDPIVFTTNYDPSIEIWCQKRNLICCDGTQPFDNPEIRKYPSKSQALSQLYSKFFIQPNSQPNELALVRLHGSVWKYKTENGKIIKYTQPKDKRKFTDLYTQFVKENPPLIYPGDESNLSRGEWDERYQFFKSRLERKCLFIGYSFRHPEINRPIVDKIKDGTISWLGILSRKPQLKIDRLFPDGDYPRKRVIPIPAEFGTEECLYHLNKQWFKHAYRKGGHYDDPEQYKRKISEWKNTRLDSYIRH